MITDFQIQTDLPGDKKIRGKHQIIKSSSNDDENMMEQSNQVQNNKSKGNLAVAILSPASIIIRSLCKRKPVTPTK